MKNSIEILGKLGIKVPEILLPAEQNIMDKWAVIACDQYSSQQDYWEKVAEFTEDTPTTLNLVYPECYLEEDNPEKRIESINRNMHDYVESGVFSEPEEGFILVKRDTPVSASRWGLIASIDLEQYDFSSDSTSLVRATEGTIIERIPPRVKIRENAELELPHIMVLIDDPEMSLIEPFIEETDNLDSVYDFELMMGSGHLSGYRIKSDKHIARIAEALAILGSTETMKAKYNSDNAFLFAMGDGNHSLATAKTIWENYKKENVDSAELMTHPSRWALVELVNIYSEGIQFEAIHRAVFNCSPADFLNKAEVSGKFRITEKESLDEVMKITDSSPELQTCGYSTANGYGIIESLSPDTSIAAGTFQNFIDEYLSENPASSVDYIHGVDVTDELGRKPSNIGLFLPAIAKNTFFQTVIDDGAFPRKTFSMGEAFEKRFYVEARKIK
ncbi:MAG: DUF1015 domain-containing protein [Spirochaetales bacterium]|uniref:DUF1015 domain-containing protein n=1 Tax=Candidatus Thalassospirochaeta sargassi TaxID=3119039 RepID=A0AAJ1IG03_9SPIO|nr:DUF1015 domain-containing protein [Spirochaetales bacterium]